MRTQHVAWFSISVSLFSNVRHANQMKCDLFRMYALLPGWLFIFVSNFFLFFVPSHATYFEPACPKDSPACELIGLLWFKITSDYGWALSITKTRGLNYYYGPFSIIIPHSGLSYIFRLKYDSIETAPHSTLHCITFIHFEKLYIFWQDCWLTATSRSACC